MKTPEYRLQLEEQFIISGHEWFHGDDSFFVSGEYEESRGKAIIYPEHDLLWLDFASEAEEPKRFKAVRDFRREFSGLPRWDKTRWVVTVGINNFEDDCIVFPFNCKTGKRLKKAAEFSSHIGAIRNGKPFEIWWADPEYPAEVSDVMGIPRGVIPDSKPYQLGGYIIKSNQWTKVQKDGGRFLKLSGYASLNLNHDLMWFAYPSSTTLVESPEDFEKERAALPRWNRTRWLAIEYIKNGPVTLCLYDYKAGRQVSGTSRGIKKIERLIESGKLKIRWHPTETADESDDGNPPPHAA